MTYRIEHLSVKAKRQLIAMHRVLLREASYTAVTRFSSGGLTATQALVDGLGELVLLQQNSRTSSQFAAAQRQGNQIAWVMSPGMPRWQYTGLVVADLGEGSRVFEKAGLSATLSQQERLPLEV
jgi:hypothetical protein